MEEKEGRRNVDWQTLSGILIILAPALVLIYDVVAGYFGGRQATLSAAVERLALAYPELPALAGGLFCWLWLHLFLSGLIARMRG